MKALITVGCKTDHGGVIALGDPSFLVKGEAIHLDGMMHYCPKCNIQSRAIAAHKGFMVVRGKSIVVVGDTSTCGSKYLKNSDIAVMSSGAGSNKSSQFILNIAAKLVEEKKENAINKIYWSYGPNFTPLEKKSRFFDDLNLHIETSGYTQGDKIDVEINPELSDITSFDSFTVSLTIDAEGTGLLKNIFQGKTIIIDTEY